jgi:hypothetical protein
MGTFMACVARQVAEPGPSCQTVSLVRWTASASQSPAGPAASVAVPAGSTGSDRHLAPAPVMVSTRFPFRTIAAPAAAPGSGSGGPLTGVSTASRSRPAPLADGLRPA